MCKHGEIIPIRILSPPVYNMRNTEGLTLGKGKTKDSRLLFHA